MTPFRRTFLILSVSQAVCLALGLWIQSRLVESASQWQRDRTPEAAQTVPATPQSFTGVKIIGFCWVAGLQAVVGYLILSRSHNEHSKHRVKSHEDSLQREKDLIRTRNAVIFGLAKLATRTPDITSNASPRTPRNSQPRYGGCPGIVKSSRQRSFA